MERVALYGDQLNGIHPAIPPIEFTGNIYTASDNVYINGSRAARVGDKTIEYCALHVDSDGNIVPQFGVLTHGSPKVFINGMPAAYAMKDIQPHDGTAELISGGSTNVFIV